MDETNRVELERVQAFRDKVEASSNDWTFTEWLTLMSELQEVAYGAHYREFDPETRADSIRMNFMAAVKELSEMTDEMGWKPWASPQGWVNQGPAMMEAVDAMHFLANLLSHAEAEGEVLTQFYKAKMLKNLQRQIDGYDAVTDKCGHCKRDLTELPPPDKLKVYETTHKGKLIKFCHRPHFQLWVAAHQDEILQEESALDG